MTVDEFVHFTRSFKVIPDIISREKLMNVLGTLSLLSNSVVTSERNNKRPRGMAIDENLFVEALALVAARLEADLSGGILDKVNLFPQ